MESGKKRIITEAEMEKQHEYARSISAMISGGKNACVITYGCQQNEADSERIAGTLADMGYCIVSEAADADLIIVNTCAVRDHAEKKALSITGGYKHLKEKNPALIIGVPVGFVNVVESKELFLDSPVPHIIARGRKGGSNVAAAICNALLYQILR